MGYSGHIPGKPVGSSKADGVSYGLERQAQEASWSRQIARDTEGYAGHVPAAKRREANLKESYRGVIPTLDGSLAARRPSSAPSQDGRIESPTAWRRGNNTGYTGFRARRESQAFVGKQVRAQSAPGPRRQTDPSSMVRAGQFSSENHMFPDVRVGVRDQNPRNIQYVRRRARD